MNATPRPSGLYVWLVPSEEVLEQPGSWRIRKWDTEPFPEANFALETRSATPSTDLKGIFALRDAAFKHSMEATAALAELETQSATGATFPRLLVRDDVVWLQLAEHDLVNLEALASGDLSQRARQAVIKACQIARSDSTVKRG